MVQIALAGQFNADVSPCQSTWVSLNAGTAGNIFESINKAVDGDVGGAADAWTDGYAIEVTMQMGQQMLRNSYGDFAETATVNIMADYATNRNVTAESLPDYMNSIALDANYTYDEESNSIMVQPGQAPTQGAREAANILFVKGIVDRANQDWINGVKMKKFQDWHLSIQGLLPKSSAIREPCWEK